MPPPDPAGRLHAAPRLRRLVGRVPGWLVAGVVYAGLGVGMWWHVWAGRPASTMVCACGDPASIAWFIAWPAYAISHGHSLLYTTWVHVPGGMNLLDNTSVLALGVALSPVSWLFGPVTALNVALTLAPPLSALSMYGCLRRALGAGRPAAFLGGLLFGFSPYMMRNEAFNHLQVTFLPLLPLIFLCCYELAVAQQGSWWRWGAGLGLAVTAQFFVGVEMLTITVFMTGIALALASLAALVRGSLAGKLPFAWRGFLLAGLVAGALLAYPAWYALAGPRHIRGAVWSAVTANGLGQQLFPVRQRDLAVIGYLGHGGTRGAYLGILALVVVAVAVAVLRRPLVVLCAILLVTAMWLSLGSKHLAISQGGQPSWLPLPWRALDGWPILKNITPANFSVVAVWCIAVAGTLLLDRVWRTAAAPAARVAAAAAVSAALVIPWLLAWPLPFTTTGVRAPAAVSRLEARLPAGAVVLFYPFPSSYQDQALVWQLEDGMRYRLVGGRGIVAGGDGSADHGFTPGTPEGTMTALTTPLVTHAVMALPPMPAPGAIRSFRVAMRAWGVTNVVMTPGGRDPAYARKWLSAALGTAPQREEGIWVWNDVQQLPARAAAG
ncbi:MAG TPA: hypothetical protein VLW44_21760 [Streptosporangiaceae bacterium]|nr:hypothetical protein [Streptosporangiaceae bacterium]